MNLSYNNFVCEFQDLLNKRCPVKRVKNTDNRYANNPWLTNGLKNACKMKNRLYKMFLSCRTLAAETRYKTYKNKLTSILRLSKKTYYSKLLVEHRNNIAETWQILRTVIGKHLKHSSYPNHFIVEGSKVDNKTEIANVFNNCLQLGPDLANNIITPTKTFVYDYLTSRNKESMFLSPIDECEVISVVNGCKSKTSTDCDDIDFRFIKSVITSIVKPVTHIFNLSFQTGTFPEKMKIAKVIPLYKSGSKNDFNNYRPISLLPQLSKILEKLHSNRLNTFTKTCDILNPCQYGFRGKMSTTHALVKVVSEITNSLNKRKHSIGVFIDLQKAFDTVDHQLLCTKLEFYGIRGVAYQWIRSYLSNRTQYVSYEGHKSEFLPIKCGVPQGSILGPLLFTIYVNDMCNVSKLVKFILFADDTNIFHSHSKLPDLVSELNKYVIYKVSHCINHSSMHILYCSLFLPHLMYCCEIWGNTYVTNIQCIILIQKRVIRLIHDANRWDHTNSLFYEYRILKFNDIVELKTILFIFDAYHNVLPYDLQQLFIKSIPLYSARKTHQFIRENVRINVRAMSIPVLGVKLWNSLNESLINIMSKYTFKRHYINILIGKYTM